MLAQLAKAAIRGREAAPQHPIWWPTLNLEPRFLVIVFFVFVVVVGVVVFVIIVVVDVEALLAQMGPTLAVRLFSLLYFLAVYVGVSTSFFFLRAFSFSAFFFLSTASLCPFFL